MTASAPANVKPRAEFDGVINFASDCVINGVPVKAGTSWRLFTKPRVGERMTETDRLYEPRKVRGSLVFNPLHILMCYDHACDLEAERDSLRAREKELVEALTEFVERGEAEGNIEGLPEFDKARAALSKVRGA